MTAQMLAAEYSSKIKISSGETVSICYAYSAVNVYNQIFKDDVARALVLKVPLCIYFSVVPTVCIHSHAHMHTHAHLHFGRLTRNSVRRRLGTP